MIIEILKKSGKEIIIRIQKCNGLDTIRWVSKNSFGDWIKIDYTRTTSKVYKWGG